MAPLVQFCSRFENGCDVFVAVIERFARHLQPRKSIKSLPEIPSSLSVATFSLRNEPSVLSRLLQLHFILPLHATLLAAGSHVKLLDKYNNMLCTSAAAVQLGCARKRHRAACHTVFSEIHNHIIWQMVETRQLLQKQLNGVARSRVLGYKLGTVNHSRKIPLTLGLDRFL